MSDIREEARAEEPLRMSAYYYSFEPTGVIEIDRILSAVARAGKAYHHTEQWDDDAYGEGSPVEWIQNAANEAGVVWADARKVEVTEPSDDALIDLWWKTSGDDWAVPDWLMVKFGRAVRALGGEQE